MILFFISVCVIVVQASCLQSVFFSLAGKKTNAGWKPAPQSSKHRKQKHKGEIFFAPSKIENGKGLGAASSAPTEKHKQSGKIGGRKMVPVPVFHSRERSADDLMWRDDFGVLGDDIIDFDEVIGVFAKVGFIIIARDL